MKKTVLLFFVCIFAFVGCTSNLNSSDVLTWQEQYDLGIRYLNDGNYEEAIIAFTAAIEIDEKNVAAYLGRAEAYVNCNDSANALADYNAAIEIDSNCQQAYVGVANIYIGQGDYDKAAEILTYISDESVKSKLLEEIERQKTDSLELAEIQLDNVTYTFSKNGEVAELNEGAVGEMLITANVISPNNAKAVLSAEWGQNISQQSQSEIKKTALRHAKMWKEEKVYIEKENTYPYEIDLTDPLFENYLGKSIDILLIGINENYDPVGYAILSAQVPEHIKSAEPIKVETVDYSRKVRLSTEQKKYISEEDYMQIVRIPKIVGDSVAVTEFNDKIMEKIDRYIIMGELDEEYDTQVWKVDYKYSVINNVVGIVESIQFGPFGGCYMEHCECFFFDGDECRELTFDEYWDKIGGSREKLNAQILREFGEKHYNISDYEIAGVFEFEGVLNVVIYTRYSRFGHESIDLQCSFEDIKK